MNPRASPQGAVRSRVEREGRPRPGEGGEVKPKRPTGGQAPSGRAGAGRSQGRYRARTTPAHGRPVDWRRAAAALPEKPDACMAHVRVCGGAGWVTTGSTRQATGHSGHQVTGRSCSAWPEPQLGRSALHAEIERLHAHLNKAKHRWLRPEHRWATSSEFQHERLRHSDCGC